VRVKLLEVDERGGCGFLPQGADGQAGGGTGALALMETVPAHREISQTPRRAV